MTWRTLTRLQSHDIFEVECLKNTHKHKHKLTYKLTNLGTNLLYNTNRKPYLFYRMVPLSMTLSDLWPIFQGHDIFEVAYRKKRRVLKTKLLFHTNRKLYLTYGIVLYLVILTDF